MLRAEGFITVEGEGPSRSTGFFMMSLAARPIAQRLVLVPIAMLLLAAAAFPAAAAAEAVSDGELAMIDKINASRTAAGLPRVVRDPILMTIARNRSTDMATRHYFSHTQPDGRTVFDFIRASGIAWTLAGEVIAWNNYPTASSSKDAAHGGWLASSGHRAVLLGRTYNRVGIGLAWDSRDQRWLWTGVFVAGPPIDDGPMGRLVGVTVPRPHEELAGSPGALAPSAAEPGGTSAIELAAPVAAPATTAPRGAGTRPVTTVTAEPPPTPPAGTAPAEATAQPTSGITNPQIARPSWRTHH
jgi:uncharacterized protein YkwD